MSIKKQKLLGLIPFFLIFILILSGCGNKKVNATSQKPNVITTTDFYGEVAKAVVGNQGSVSSIINNPAIDPHDYEPTTKIAKQVSQADIVVANGLGYDAWMNKLNKKDKAAYIKIGEDVMNKTTGDNPHLWYDPTTMTKYANYLAKELAKKDPQHKTYFEKNAAKYIASLKPVQSEVATLKQTAQKTTNKKVYVSEPVFDYSLQAIGFTVANKNFEKAVENGTDPSPAVIKQMQDGIKAKRIAFLVFNTQTDSKLVNNLVQLAQKNNVPVLKVTETLPASKTYQSWMLSQYKALNKILQNEG